MKDSSTYNLNESISLLLQGPWGSGKTSLALQFPSPYIADCDNNLTGPLRYHRSNNLAPAFKWDTIDVDDEGKEVPEVQRYPRLMKCLNSALADPEIKTIIIDSAFKVQGYIKAELERQGKTGYPLWAGLVVGWQQLVSRLKTSGKIFVLIAHEKPEKDEVEGIIKYFIDLQGAFQNEIGRHFSDVWRCENDADPATNKTKYYVRTVPTARLQLKTSLALPPRFPVDWKTISDAMKQGTTQIEQV